jgi:uncharacterized membrane protein (UPF0127 family)
VHGVEDLVVSAAALARPGHASGRYRRVLAVVLAVVVVAAGCSSGRDRAGPVATTATASNSTTVATTAGAARTTTVAMTPSGFAAVSLRVTAADGSAHESCVLVAITDAERARGLMDVDSLGGYDGMLFRFAAPTAAQFYMFHTRLPLSIAFFDGNGGYVAASDMPPCTASAATDCPVYGAPRRYVDALEVAQGGLSAVGVGPGSRVEAGEDCARSP